MPSSPDVTEPQRRPAPERVRTLQARFSEATTQATSREDLLARMARTLSEIVRADLLGLARVNGQGELSVEGLLHPIAGLPEQTTKSLLDYAHSVTRERQTRMGHIGRAPNQLLISVPIHTSAVPEAFLALFLTPVAAPDVLTTVVELAVATISLFDLRASTTVLDREASQTAALVDLAARVQSETTVAAAGQVLCDEVTRHLNVVQTAVGMSSPGDSQSRLIAVSRHAAHVSPERRDTLLEAALDECLLRGEPACWPPPPGTPRHSLVTHKQLALRWNAESVVSIPLRTHTGEIVGAWLAIVPSQQKSLEVIGFMQAATPLTAAALRSLQRGERGRLATVWIQLTETLRKRRGRLVVLTISLVLGLLCIPMPYAVRGGCEVQPVSLRYIAAPFEARLLQAEAEPGDEVAAGQLLAQLDGEEIRWELSGATAEFDRAAKERDSHLAEKDFNAAQVARLEMARMDAKASVLRQRSDQLEIRSPVNGVVISGDLRKAEGAPLTTGQTLFEIAPLDEMVIEIGIPEDDITHVSVGQSMEAVLNALPDRSWVGQITRIHPRTELVDQDYVFVAEVHFKNDLGLLRPGMKGRAKITTDRHPLGWNLFHKAVDQVRFWTGW